MNDGPTTTTPRLLSLDFLRGLALTMVLVDHIDDIIERHEFFTRWTLKGLGFSDAAEAFVFLSGFTFGWVYSTRLDRDGFWFVQRRALLRTIQIYVATMLTTLIAACFALWLSRSIRLPLTITSWAMFKETIREAALLREPIWGLGILAVYVAVLPFLPAMLWLARRSWLGTAVVSLMIYAGSQMIPALDFSDAGFNPLAWQILIVAGLLLGDRARQSRLAAPMTLWILGTAATALVAGFIVMHGPELAGASSSLESLRGRLLSSPALSKTNLGIARIAHFAAVAFATLFAVQRWPGFAEQRWARPLVVSGRHSLTLFCLGVLLAYVCAVASRFLPDNLLALLFLAADAVLIQFAVAWLLERRRARSQPH